MTDPPFRLVVVRWLDAYSEDGWAAHDATDVTAEHEILTVGYVVHESPRYLVIAGTVGRRTDGKFDVSGVMGIPKGCIVGQK